MFVQVIQGHVTDRAAVREAFDSWQRELSTDAEGWLGTTAGITPGGYLVALARFESPEAAARNSERPQQHQWWMDTQKLFAGEVVFHNCRKVDEFLAGVSGEAGFVQVIQGTALDPDRLADVTRRSESALPDHRPDILGGIVAMHGENGDFTQAVYFTSESAAREGERRTPPPDLAELFDEEQRMLTDVRYYDLTEPWHYPSG